jgi:hypothetical protein
METKRLQEVVTMVSSILTDYPVQSKTLPPNIIVISTPIWDFYLSRVDNDGCYTLDEIGINDSGLANEHSYTKQQIQREVFGRYCITNSL